MGFPSGAVTTVHPRVVLGKSDPRPNATQKIAVPAIKLRRCSYFERYKNTIVRSARAKIPVHITSPRRSVNQMTIDPKNRQVATKKTMLVRIIANAPKTARTAVRDIFC